MSTPTRRPLAFLAPMPAELEPLQAAMALHADRPGPTAWHTGSLDGRPVVAALCGIGVRRATARAHEILHAHTPAHVIVIGVAGALAAHLQVGDVVIPDVVVDLADDRELHPTQLGTSTTSGRLLTSDDFIKDPATLTRLRDAGATAIDMETAAIARVCEDNGVTWSAYRGISDDAFDPLVDEAVLALTQPDGTPDLRAVARFVGRNPSRVRLLKRLARDLHAATTGAVDAALRASRSATGSE